MPVSCEKNDADYLMEQDYKLIIGDFLKCGTYIRHDEEKIANQILQLLKEI